MTDELNVSDRWLLWRQRVDLAEYNTRWDRMAADGASVHDEADLVCRLGAHTVLDAGCGTGRVAIELAARGKSVVGVDNDADMLELAAAKTDQVEWVLADLASVQLGQRFDLVLMAGDVLNYVGPGRESQVISNLVRHLEPYGTLLSGGSIAEPDQLNHYDNWCRSAGLELKARYASWAGAPYGESGHYAVSMHGLSR